MLKMDNKFSIKIAKKMDREDPLFKLRKNFHIPLHQGKECVYFTGNSLGLQLKNHEVYGTSIDSEFANISKLKLLNIWDKVKIVTTLKNDFRSICKTILMIKLSEIYKLVSQSSVSLSFDHPMAAID